MCIRDSSSTQKRLLIWFAVILAFLLFLSTGNWQVQHRCHVIVVGSEDPLTHVTALQSVCTESFKITYFLVASCCLSIFLEHFLLIIFLQLKNSNNKPNIICVPLHIFLWLWIMFYKLNSILNLKSEPQNKMVINLLYSNFF